MHNRENTALLKQILFLLILICIYQFMVATNATLPSTELYIDPQTSIGMIDSSFTINVNIADVVNLYGWEVRMIWNATILDAVEVTQGSFLKSSGDTFFTNVINNTEGYLIADCTLLGNAMGVSGNGVLMTVDFYVKTSGQSILDLNETTLLNPLEQPIEHTKTDAYFYTTLHDVAVIRIDTSPATVNVTVKNQGTQTETFNVSAYYTLLVDPLIGTQTVTLESGAETTLVFNWHPQSFGRYEMCAVASTTPNETNMNDNTLVDCFNLEPLIGQGNTGHYPY